MISQQKQAEQAFGSVKYSVSSFSENCSMELTRAVRPKKAWSATRDSIGQSRPCTSKSSARSTAVKLALCLPS